jgi:hypothetical protein
MTHRLPHSTTSTTVLLSIIWRDFIPKHIKQPGWRNWLARVTFNHKVESSSLSSGNKQYGLVEGRLAHNPKVSWPRPDFATFNISGNFFIFIFNSQREDGGICINFDVVEHCNSSEQPLIVSWSITGTLQRYWVTKCSSFIPFQSLNRYDPLIYKTQLNSCWRQYMLPSHDHPFAHY